MKIFLTAGVKIAPTVQAAVYQVAAKPARREVPQLTVPQALALQFELQSGKEGFGKLKFGGG